MRRYTDTFFRYWLIALVPVIVLPLAGYALIHKQPRTVIATARIWVDPSPAGAGAFTYNQYVTPALNEVDTLNQLLQISSFDWSVVQGSSLYAQRLKKVPNPLEVASTDLTKNVQFVATGNNLVTVSYSSKNWQLSAQVVQSLLSAVLNQTQLFNRQQTAESIAYYSYQLQAARKRLTQSTQQLSKYMDAHGITPNALITQQAVDPALATLYQQVQFDQQNVTTAQQQLAKLQSQSQVPSSVSGQSGFHVVDPPRLSAVSRAKVMLLQLALFAVAGLVLGGGFVVVKTMLDRSLRYPDEVPEVLNLPVLAVLPYDPAHVAPRGGPSTSTKRTAPGARPTDLRRIG